MIVFWKIRTPDLNYIEQVWVCLNAKLVGKIYRTREDLKLVLNYEYKEMDYERLVSTMHNNIKSIITLAWNIKIFMQNFDFKIISKLIILLIKTLTFTNYDNSIG